MQEQLVAKINDQLNKELYSGYIYLGMAACFEEGGLPGFAHWMKCQASEEQEHAMRLFEYLVQRGERVKLTAIEEPRFEYDSALDAFEAGLEHEKYVTGLIDDLYEMALEADDHAAAIFLQWFVTEQVEEEESFTKMRDDLLRLGDCEKGLYMLDRAAAARE